MPGMVMGRCTQAHVQLHSAHGTCAHTGLHTQLGTRHCQHVEPAVHTLGTHAVGAVPRFSTPCHRHTCSRDHLL